MNVKSLQKISILFIVFLMLCGIFGMTASAYDEQDYVVANDKRRVPIPITYNPVSVENYLGEEAGQLSAPSDIFISSDDRIYIVDGGKNRIVSMNTDYSDVKVISDFSGQTLNNPQGIYVYDNGDLLIADTDNSRVLHTDPNGNIIKIYTQPTSSLYDTTYAFKPIKVYVNVINQIYIINNEDYHGFIVLDENNDFKGYVASTKVPYNLTTKLVQMFASEEQKAVLAQEKPPAHTNAVIDDENTIYATTARAEEAQLKRFSPVGVNIYPFKGYFGETRGDYVLQYYGKTFTEPEFTDVTINADGVVSILDSVTGRIYQYDSEGNMLTAFGGTGKWVGKFTGASGLAQDSKGNMYVIDKVQSTIHKLEPTEFIDTVHAALNLYYDGKYDDAVLYWEQVLNMNPNYPMAHIGMGNAYLRNDEFELAMDEFRLADDKSGYSSAFDKWELEVVRQFFGIVLFAIIAIAVLVIVLIGYLRRRYKQTYDRPSRFKFWNNKGRLKILLGTLFDSNEGYREIRRHRTDYDLATPLVLYLLVAVAKIFSLFVVHYPFRSAEIYEINLASEMLTTFVPLVTWVIASYMVTTICSGEVKMREVFSASAYCMLPYVIVTIPLSLISNVMSSSSSGLYTGIITLMWIWVGIMFFVSTMSMNSYGFMETVKIVLLTLFACVFMWLVVLLIFMLGEQVVDFFKGIFDNFKIYFAMQGGN